MKYLIIIFIFLSSSMFAATLDSIQSGITYMSAGTGSVNQTISGVDLTKSFLVFTISVDANSPGSAQVSGKMISSTQLQFRRFNTGGTPIIKIEWQVFEFSSGVTVQRGEVNTVSGADANATLSSAVDLSKSFPIASIRKDGGTYGTDDFITPELTSSTNLFIDREPGGGDIQNVIWQVVEWDAASVQQISGTLASGNDSVAVTLPTHVDKNKSFVVSYHRVNGNIDAADMPCTELHDDSTLITYRIGTTSACPFLAYVIELSDDTEVIHGAASMLTTQDSVSVLTTPFDVNKSGVIPPSHFSRTGINCETTDDDMGIAYGAFKLDSDHSINVSRGGTGFRARFPYQILDLSSTPLPSYSNGAGYTDSRLDLCAVVLPAELSNFTHEHSTCNNITFKWSTASEINVNHFELEGSNTSAQWALIKKIDAVGNSNVTLNYNADYNITKPYKYYRLVTRDFDGQVSYSKVLVVNVERCGDKIVVRYNGSDIYAYTQNVSDIQIFNSLGQVIQIKPNMLSYSSEYLKIETSYLAPGIYVLKAGEQTAKFIR